MMRGRMRQAIYLGLALWIGSFSIQAAESEQIQKRRKIFEGLSQEMAGGAMELRELEIRAKIYEPQVVYILDRAKIEVHFKEDQLHFSPRIQEVIEDDQF